ncbi:MAG: hypothetical protein SVS15_04120 [Thermodesulfobacteriota bacterium]|nr:hypothetical protein [Thermodesulfobacteriota bacterium]
MKIFQSLLAVLAMALLSVFLALPTSSLAKSWGGPKCYNATEKGAAVQITDADFGFDWHQVAWFCNNTNGTASNSSAYVEVVAVCNMTNLGVRNQTLSGQVNASNPIPSTFTGRFQELWVRPVGMDIEDIVTCVEYYFGEN